MAKKSRFKYKSLSSRKELKQKAVNYKGGKCESCGYNKCLAALTFHHKNPKKKDFTISYLMNIVSWDKLLLELNKTHLLCTNCHTEVHNKILDGYIEDDEY